MRIVALIENSRPDDRVDLTAEFGLSLYVERAGQRILFDTGSSGALADNAEKLGVDLREVDAAVVSHHHFDHGGGLARFLGINHDAKVYLRRSGEKELYFKALLLGERYVGLDQHLLEEQAGRLEFLDGFAEILPGVYILTAIDTQYPQPKGNKRLFVKKDGVYQQDDFGHELLMVTRERDGLVVFTGCSHHGVRNMLSTVTREFKDTPIKAAVGGFHLVGLPVLNTMADSRKDIRRLAGELLKYPVGQFHTGHCTGPKAYRVMKEVMADRLQRFQTGSELVL